MPVTGQLLPGVRQLPTGYDVDNSCRFEASSSQRMVKTLGTPTSTKIGTVSCWIKRGSIGVEQHFFGTKQDGNDRCSIGFDDSAEGELHIVQEDSGSYSYRFKTTARFRDPSAWLHLVLAIDTTQASASNRVKIYINGTQVTSFATETQPSQDTVIRYGISGEELVVGAKFGGGGSYGNFYSGYLAEVVFIDGQQLDPTSFGEFDSDSPNIWKPIDVSGLTFGNNGFYLDFKDSSNLGNDANGGTDLTESNLTATDQSTDTCTNNFATLNPLNPIVHDFEEGNLRIDATASNWDSAFSTIGASSGKWYFELKFLSKSSEPLVRSAIGVVDARGQTQFATNEVGYTVSGASGDSVGYNGNGSNNIKKNDSAQYSGTNWNVNDIICMAVDLDNGAVYFRVNDSAWLNSGDPTSGSTKTGAVTITTGETYVFGGTAYDASTEWQFNFGAPSFSISSGNADANGHGNFEYAVPSGYFALCTKNLAENG
jgi:hypothetical protein